MADHKHIDRKAKHRILNSAGYVHASGWIDERDKPAFDRMVAEARDGVDMIVEKMGERKAK